MSSVVLDEDVKSDDTVADCVGGLGTPGGPRPWCARWGGSLLMYTKNRRMFLGHGVRKGNFA